MCERQTTETMMHKLRTAFSLMVAMTVFAAPALTQPAPNTEGGRYSFVPVREGLIRLDVKSGEVSTCIGNDTGWTCRVTPDERATFNAEIERLRAETAKLKSDLAARGSSDAV